MISTFLLCMWYWDTQIKKLMLFNYVQVIDPSLQLKQRTTAGVAKIKKQLERTKRTRNMILPPAQLQRGRLKALGRPVTASDPLVNNCQGILAGKSVHGESGP